MLDSIRRVAGNAISILTSDMVNRATTFVLYLLVARFLGPYEFGQMSLALTLFYLFQVLARGGLKTLVTREVAKDKSKTDEYLVTGSVIVAGFSLLSVLLLLLFVRLMGYSPDTAEVIVLLSLGLLPYSLSAVCEGVFQAWERMKYIAIANASANITKVGLAYLLLTQGYGLYHLVALVVLSQVAILFIEWVFILRSVTRPRIHLDGSIVVSVSRSTSTFLGIDGIIAIIGSLNVILLSGLRGETEVGFYSAGAQLLAPMILFYQGIALSVFPMMSRRFESGIDGLVPVSRYMSEFLMAIALPVVLILFFLADQVLLLLYHEEGFLLASEALRIMVWTLLLTALTFVMGHVLLASLREKVSLQISAVNLAVMLAVGLVLINQFGVIGAAVTSLVTRIVGFIQHYTLVKRIMPGYSLAEVLWRPVAAGTCMGLVLIGLRDQGAVLAAASGLAVYVGALAILEIWSIGGMGQLRALLQLPRSQ